MAYFLLIAIILVLLVAYFLYERLVKYDGRHLLDVVEKSPMDILSPRQASDGVTNYLTIAPVGLASLIGVVYSIDVMNAEWSNIFQET